MIWSIALGSGTSGGVLAPLLLVGAGVGGVLGAVLPGGSIAVWCLLGMAAALAGVMRSPFTAVVFAVELTHDANALLPLLIAATAAHLMSVLLLRRSILTEKVARRGVHVSREYASDPLEALRVREVMRTDLASALPVAGADGAGPVVAHPDETLRRAADRMAEHGLDALPVVGDDPERVVGVVTPLDLFRAHVRAQREEVHRERGIGPPV